MDYGVDLLMVLDGSLEGLLVSLFGQYLKLAELSKKIIFKSEGNDNRTQAEKDVDEAIGKLLEGATPIDKQGKPLKPGQKVSGAKNYIAVISLV
jgi:hypothetical protein